MRWRCGAAIGTLSLPVIIVAGEGDKVVFRRRSEQLRDAIPGAVLRLVEGAGHMVHHAAPLLVAQSVERVREAAMGARRNLLLPACQRRTGWPPSRQPLQADVRACSPMPRLRRLQADTFRSVAGAREESGAWTG